jgi:hypothetical protein
MLSLKNSFKQCQNFSVWYLNYDLNDDPKYVIFINFVKKKLPPPMNSGIPYVKQTDFLGPFDNKKSTGKAVRHRENFDIELNLIGQGGKTLVKETEIQHGYICLTPLHMYVFNNFIVMNNQCR